MAARDFFVKKAARAVLRPGESILQSCLVTLPGTLKREGYYGAIRGITGISIQDVAGDGGLPPKMIMVVTEQRLLLFEQTMIGFAKGLSAEIDRAQVAGGRQTGTSRAQVSVKVYGFAIDFADGNSMELESADRAGLDAALNLVNAPAQV